MRSRRIFAVAMIVTTTVFVLSAAADAPSVRSELLVSTEWLASSLSRAEVVVLHVGNDRAAYDAGHIPGARFLPLSELVVMRDGRANELPPAEQLVRSFERLGVGDNTRVVLYGERQGLWAARAFFTLDYLGHGQHALLDGGLEKWKQEGRPLSAEEPKPAAAKLTPRLRPELVVDFNAMRDLSFAATAAESAPHVLLDARPREQFTGAESASPQSPRKGRIPGAQSLYWMETLAGAENPVLRPAEEVRKMFAAAGAAPGKTVVTYCQSGVQASHAYFTARYLGYDAALYDGSFSEWSAKEDAPVATGEPQ